MVFFLLNAAFAMAILDLVSHVHLLIIPFLKVYFKMYEFNLIKTWEA